MSEENRQSDWDSSKACLQRIDRLIQLIHMANSGIYDLEEGLENRQRYVRYLYRLYIEGQTKFSEKEKKQASIYLNKIKSIRKHFKNNLHQPFINRRIGGMGWQEDTPIKNREYSKGWGVLLNITEKFEVYLMNALDKHNMLLRDKARVEDELI